MTGEDQTASTSSDQYAQGTIDSAEDLYDRLERFIWWRAHQLCDGNRNHVLLEVDDVAAEMFVTLVECWQNYHEREGMNAATMLQIVRASCDNTCRSLLITYYGTQKRLGDARLVSIDEVLDLAEECDVEAVLESQSRVSAFLDSLSPDQRRIVRAILSMDERIARRAVLEGIRKDWVFSEPGPVKCNYRLIADALGLEYNATMIMWYRIRKKWKRYQYEE